MFDIDINIFDSLFDGFNFDEHIDHNDLCVHAQKCHMSQSKHFSTNKSNGMSNTMTVMTENGPIEVMPISNKSMAMSNASMKPMSTKSMPMSNRSVKPMTIMTENGPIEVIPVSTKSMPMSNRTMINNSVANSNMKAESVYQTQTRTDYELPSNYFASSKTSNVTTKMPTVNQSMSSVKNQSSRYSTARQSQNASMRSPTKMSSINSSAIKPLTQKDVSMMKSSPVKSSKRSTNVSIQLRSGERVDVDAVHLEHEVVDHNDNYIKVVTSDGSVIHAPSELVSIHNSNRSVMDDNYHVSFVENGTIVEIDTPVEPIEVSLGNNKSALLVTEKNGNEIVISADKIIKSDIVSNSSPMSSKRGMSNRSGMKSSIKEINILESERNQVVDEEMNNIDAVKSSVEELKKSIRVEEDLINKEKMITGNTVMLSQKSQKISTKKNSLKELEKSLSKIMSTSTPQ